MRHRFLTRAMTGAIRQTLWALLYGSVGGALVLVVVGVAYLEGRPDLDVWHTADLDAEFTADSPVETFGEYLALEERLFAQVDERVYGETASAVGRSIERFARGSLSDPARWPTDWNRSYELRAEAPAALVLLVHGMSDSPYSLRSLAEALHARGDHVLGLRVPGHGTAPVGLVDVTWQDMAAAVAIAMRHLHEQADGRPLHLVGYSNGAALAVQYALSALEDPSLPQPSGLVLISPEIGLTRLAALAVWQERLGDLLGLEKLQWNSILPEYDPWKYGSFALNAGKQAYLLTEEIQSRIAKLLPTGLLERLPPVIAFQSVVDATVTAPALVDGLFARLPPGPHELVLFDINRYAAIEFLLNSDPSAWIDGIVGRRDLGFALTLVTNDSPRSLRVVARRYGPGAAGAEVDPLDLEWPRLVYSLSHVALPFAPDDPVYGGPEAGPSPGIQIGNVAPRGERGSLRIGAADLLRLRWNPFYAYLERRVLAHVR